MQRNCELRGPEFSKEGQNNRRQGLNTKRKQSNIKKAEREKPKIPYLEKTTAAKTVRTGTLGTKWNMNEGRHRMWG